MGFEFQWGDDETPTIEGAVMQAVGAASMCWDEIPKGIFDSTRAKEIGEKLITFIEEKSEVQRLREFIDACVQVGSGHGIEDPIRVEGPADARWEAVKPR